MAALTGQLHKDTYKDLLQVSNSNGGIDATLRAISDGEGTASAVMISSGALSIDNVKFDGNTISITNTDGSLTLSPNGTGMVVITGTSTSAATIALNEDTDNGTNYIALKAPASIATSLTFTLPSVDGTSGQALVTNGSGTLSFSSTVFDLVNDVTPQLGADLDGNSFSIGMDNATGIKDDSGNEQLIFNKTASAVTYITVTNAATGNAPIIAAAGETNTDLKLSAAGTGAIVLTGSATSAAALRLSEDTDNGTNYVAFKAPASIASNVTWTLPSADGSSSQIMETDGSGTLAFTDRPRPNLIHNATFRIAQRNTSFTSATLVVNNDDTYTLDRWVLLSDGNDIVDVSQNSSTVPTGAFNSISLDVETANKKFGILQILEAKEAQAIIAGTASLSFKARKGSANVTLETLRAAVISWSSTADSVTSDVVSAWNTAGTDPTLVANWTYENSPSNLTLTTSFQTFKIENIAIDTVSTTNVAVFIWCDDVDATVEDFVFISEVKLEKGSKATNFMEVSMAEDELNCTRYFRKSTGSPILTASDYGCYNVTNTTSVANNAYYAAVDFPVPMRTSPTVVTYPFTTPANTGRWSNDVGTDYGANSATVTVQSSRRFVVRNTSGGALAHSQGMIIGQWYASADL